MKFFLSLILFSFFNIPAVWLTDFAIAKENAAQSHKLILLNFSGSDWCGPCIRLRKDIFESDVFNQFAEKNLILVNADFPRLKKHQLNKEQEKQNEALADQYNNQGKFPYTVLLNSDGKVLKAWEGYPDESPQQFVEELNAVAHDGH